MWLTAHFLFWDYTTTRAAETFTVNGVIQYLGSKDLAIFNQIAIWGTVSSFNYLIEIPNI